MQLALKEGWTSGKEIEVKYIADQPDLQNKYHIFHQAEMGSGKAECIIPNFQRKTQEILSDYDNAAKSIEALFRQITPLQLTKIRTRRILNPETNQLRAEFTIKLKTKHPDFKIYDEYNLDIDPELSLRLIDHIAPGHRNSEGDIEHGVLKYRYNIPGPDNQMWDVDTLQGVNKGLNFGEREIPYTDTPIVLPKWAVHKVNGDKNLKFLGTKELQETPWIYLPQIYKDSYLRHIKSQKSSWLKKVIGI